MKINRFMLVLAVIYLALISTCESRRQSQISTKKKDEKTGNKSEEKVKKVLTKLIMNQLPVNNKELKTKNRYERKSQQNNEAENENLNQEIKPSKSNYKNTKNLNSKTAKNTKHKQTIIRNNDVDNLISRARISKTYPISNPQEPQTAILVPEKSNEKIEKKMSNQGVTKKLPDLVFKQPNNIKARTKIDNITNGKPREEALPRFNIDNPGEQVGYGQMIRPMARSGENINSLVNRLKKKLKKNTENLSAPQLLPSQGMDFENNPNDILENNQIGNLGNNLIGNFESTSNLNENLENNLHGNVENNQNENLGNDQKENVGNNQNENLGNDQKENVGNNQNENLGSNQNGNNQLENVENNQIEDLDNNQIKDLDNNQNQISENNQISNLENDQNTNLGKSQSTNFKNDLNVGSTNDGSIRQPEHLKNQEKSQKNFEEPAKPVRVANEDVDGEKINFSKNDLSRQRMKYPKVYVQDILTPITSSSEKTKSHEVPILRLMSMLKYVVKNAVPCYKIVILPQKHRQRITRDAPDINRVPVKLGKWEGNFVNSVLDKEVNDFSINH